MLMQDDAAERPATGSFSVESESESAMVPIRSNDTRSSPSVPRQEEGGMNNRWGIRLPPSNNESRRGYSQ